MSRISNLQQTLSQSAHVEKVQQVQQIQGDLEHARLAAHSQKRSKGKKETVQDVPPSDPIELHNRKKDDHRERRDKDREAPEEKTDNPNRVNHIDVLA